MSTTEGTTMWKHWRTVNGCEIKRQPLPHHPRGYFEYETFTPDGERFTDAAHSRVAFDEAGALEAAAEEREPCPSDCEGHDA